MAGAAIYSLIESAKLNGLNPQHYLADVLSRKRTNLGSDALRNRRGCR
jgi:hypothetical protein